MKKSLPGTLGLETDRGTREVPLVELQAVDVPAGNGGVYRHRVEDPRGWDGHSSLEAPGFLRRWTFPKLVRDVRDRVRQAIEDGIPEQRRTVRRNEADGTLDDRWITDIALGEEVDRPFWRWSKQASKECRVALCFDATACVAQPAPVLEARMAVAAGLASALEAADYQVSIVAAASLVLFRTPPGYDERLLRTLKAWANNSSHPGYLTAEDRASIVKPRQAAQRGRLDLRPRIVAQVVKAEHEPMVDSGFARFADTGMQRLMASWSNEGNGFLGSLTDGEWRTMTGADLLVYVGGKPLNQEGAPERATFGPTGDDVLRLEGLDVTPEWQAKWSLREDEPTAKDLEELRRTLGAAVDKSVARVEAFFREGVRA